MLDFTSALYLGLTHPSRSLRPWLQFTLGVPAALASPPDAYVVAQQLASLQGCERGLLGTSTLHLFWDLFGMLSRHRVDIYVDAGTYPIGRWGVERAAARGIPVRAFRHHDAGALQHALRESAGHKRRPVLLTDGFCPACGKLAPLPAYLDGVRAYGGLLIIDDTQAVGVLGHSPRPDAPYGHGGGGTLPWFNIQGEDVLAVSSLAKGFGAPLAVLCGSRRNLQSFESNSETRMHCSPPAVATIRAAEHALRVNHERGDWLRRRLAQLVIRFRYGASQAGLHFIGGLFPVQTLAYARNSGVLDVHEKLLHRGIQTVVRDDTHTSALRLSILISARHTTDEIDLATATLAQVGTDISVLSSRIHAKGNHHELHIRV